MRGKIMHFSATREIQIDAGHRIPDHRSKCKNLHGHRYVIQATFSSDHLVAAGSEKGMVKDFAFMKEIMMDEIDRLCDHGLMIYHGDPLLKLLLVHDVTHFDAQLAGIMGHVTINGGHGITGIESQKLYITDFVPTAENLAKHWYDRLTNRVFATGEPFTLDRVRVFETPNCFADYPTR